ncbi:MAG: class I SAM-dependent methyltransferase [Actinomycetota bacterium]|nr:class I SAM-dependent methyltransferase [Actinomycetota bacterium]
MDREQPHCRGCGAVLTLTFLDLGQMPLANAYPRSEADAREEKRYPLHVRICDRCFLVQLDQVVSPSVLFEDYAYFSSYSETWLEHSRRFADWAVGTFGLTHESSVIEVASNDGYLLKHFVALGIPVLGIEPAANVAAAAIDAGVPTDIRFFGRSVAEDLVGKGYRADLLVGNNVIAHVPDLNDFVAGLAILLGDRGVVSLEFPHLLRLVDQVQFDTIYHEHFCYFSLLSLESVLRRHGLEVFDVVELPTHGGSLRVLVSRSGGGRAVSPRLVGVRNAEADARLHELRTYDAFKNRVETCCRSLRDFLASARAGGSSVVAYGAAAKGNTLLNHCGVGTDDIAYVVDRSPHKQGRLLPGSHLPIHAPEKVRETRPDHLLLLPWNLKDEIIEQMSFIRGWGGRFVVPIPVTQVLD